MSVSAFIVWNVSCSTVYATLVLTLIFSPLSWLIAVDITLSFLSRNNKSLLFGALIPFNSNGLDKNTTCLPNNDPSSTAILSVAVSGVAILTLP